MVKLSLSVLLLFASGSYAIEINKRAENNVERLTDKYEPEHSDAYLETRDFNLRHQPALNLTHKKYTQFDLAEDEIPWDHNNRYKLIQAVRDHHKNASQLHQPANKSSINWNGVPDALVEKMKENNAMPGRGIPNHIFMMSPFEPSWFRSWNQKFMPNGTEFTHIDYDKMDQMISEISKEMEAYGVHGAEKAFKLMRPYSNKKNFLQWMTLWKHGGIFMDGKQGWTTPVSDWVDFQNDELVGCADPSMITDDQFIMMTKHHPVGLMMTQHQIDNVNARVYYDGHDGQRYSDLNITGPDSYRDMLITRHQGTWDNFRCSKEINEKTLQYAAYLMDGKEGANRTKIYQNDPVPGEGVFMKMKNCTKCNDYKTLMRNRQIYCDQPGPTLGCDGKDWHEFIDENSWKHLTTSGEEWVTAHFDPKVDSEYNQTAIAQEKLLTHDVYLAHKPKDAHIWPEQNWQ